MTMPMTLAYRSGSSKGISQKGERQSKNLVVVAAWGDVVVDHQTEARPMLLDKIAQAAQLAAGDGRGVFDLDADAAERALQHPIRYDGNSVSLPGKYEPAL